MWPLRKSQKLVCPGCKSPMKPTGRKPLMFAPGLVDITYSCRKCGGTVTRTVKDGRDK